MKKIFALTLITAMLFSLAGCSSEDVPTLTVYNWGDYIGDGVIEQFEEEFGCKVNYEMFDQNEDMYTKITKAGGEYDVVIPSEYMIERMINEGLLAELNHENIPNMANLSEYVLDRDFDQGNKYSVPYMWGTVGIVYNKTMVNGEITSWNDLWDPQYEGQIFMMNSVRDSMAVALMTLGLDPNTREQADIEAAQAKLIEQKPLVLAYTGDEVKDKMIAGEAAMAVIYSGDAANILMENEDLV
ncbi:MAG: extracellular solute-binding protein, partial [Clostridia bacterium]|nr:extracellular solute-binding protein [Clostridia bacterium]